MKRYVILTALSLILIGCGDGSSPGRYDTGYEDGYSGDDYSDLDIAETELEETQAELEEVQTELEEKEAELKEMQDQLDEYESSSSYPGSSYTSYVSAYQSTPSTAYTPPPTSLYTSSYSAPSYNSYEYESRSGSTGNYSYEYNVGGYDYSGNMVNGSVQMDGKYGSGYVVDGYGNAKEVQAEWTDYGKIEAQDFDGNTYELETDGY